MNEQFERELTQLLNRACAENGSGTPDFILASFLKSQLELWNATIAQREKWYGRAQDKFGMPAGLTFEP
jgi:hypothetical protein